MKKLMLDTVVSIAKERVGKLADKVINLVANKQKEPTEKPTRKRKHGEGSVYSHRCSEGIRWSADYKKGKIRVHRVFPTEEEAHKFLDDLVAKYSPEQQELPFVEEEQPPAPVESSVQMKAPARSWIYDSINKKYTRVVKSTVLEKGCYVLNVQPFSPDELPMLVGSVVQNPPYRRMMIVASAYNKIYFGGVTAPQDPAKILEEGWTFVDSGKPFGVFNENFYLRY